MNARGFIRLKILEVSHEGQIYTIYFKGGELVEGTLEHRPDKNHLCEINEIVIRKTTELKKPPEGLIWRFAPD